MSEFVEVEWFGRDHKIGIVLTYDEHDGFKVRMAPIEAGVQLKSEQADIDWLMKNAAKVPFEWAKGFFGPRMKTEWMRRHLADEEWLTVRYDGKDYDTTTLV
ncbi:hypothetical protein KC992_04975 [Candidatus Saccharibacteria bacterium]|nr:hypothetical protein [Candidatus Saccharibacteria bacterium]